MIFVGAGAVFSVTAVIMDMMGSFTVLRLASMVGMANINFTKEELLAMNKQLNKIRKPRSSDKYENENVL